MTPPPGLPIADAELPGLFAPLAAYGDVFLAVSGGADSTALMTLAARWQRLVAQPTPRITVLTVDHGLRPEAAAEAAAAAAAARRLGLEADVLTWRGDRPQSGVQEAAREIRYGLLLARAAAAPTASALVTAHHRDDLAETLLMRLARGSGVDGLSAMQPVSMRGDIALLRPLLDVPRQRLEATIVALGVDWIVDPSNENPAFERVRLRQAQPARAELGLDDAALARSARRLARARNALDNAVSALLEPRLGCPDLTVCGVFNWPWPLATLEPELAIRLLIRLLPVIGGSDSAVRLSRVERLFDEMQQTSFRSATLGNCIIAAVAAAHPGFTIYREPHRASLPTVETDLAIPLVWDNRFEIGHRQATGARPPPRAENVRIRPFARRDRVYAVEAPGSFAAAPCEALESTPVIEDNQGGIWIPALDVHRPDRSRWSAFFCRFRAEILAKPPQPL